MPLGKNKPKQPKKLQKEPTNHKKGNIKEFLKSLDTMEQKLKIFSSLQKSKPREWEEERETSTFKSGLSESDLNSVTVRLKGG